MEHFTEENYENAIIELFSDKLGYETICGYDVTHDVRSPLHLPQVERSLARLNPSLPAVAIENAIQLIQEMPRGSIISENIRFSDYLQNGIAVNYWDGGEEKSTLVHLVDFENTDNNSFIVANQWTITEASERRPDLLLFLNGFPVMIAELKSPVGEKPSVLTAYSQIRNYMKEIPCLFRYNMICVLSDFSFSKAGTISSDLDRYMDWKTTDGSYENTDFANYDTFFEGIFQKERFLDILKNFLCFSNEGTEQRKILAGYHQYFAVKKALASTRKATESDGKGGVFWHTQGSGKSLSMVFYAQLLQKELASPTIVVITDRNDLDNQLYGQFTRCSHFLRQTPKQAESRQNLIELLGGIKANGIFFTTMQKFEESDEPLSNRRNIIVVADEAHRGQYGLEEKVNAEGKITVGIARIIRDSLPNATFIGFTGTPISSKDRSTLEVFGNYIDIYDMTQAVKDGATRPVFYESRVIQLSLDKELLGKIDNLYDSVIEETDTSVIEKSKRELGNMEVVLGAEETIDSLVNDILVHYEENRQHLLTGKAMIVAYSRPIAMKIYRKILALRPDWNEKVAVVMTSGNSDPEDWRDVIGNSSYKTELAKTFKKNDSKLKIVIVVDMWLTGFDVPSLSTMYVYKPMSGHNLMQAIARVNRVFGEKTGGLVVDYVGIAGALKKAMSDYTARDKAQYGDMDISKQALPQFMTALSVCRDLIHGFNYKLFLTSTSDGERASILKGGANFILSKEVGEQDLTEEKRSTYLFKKHILILTQSLSLCSSIVERDLRIEAAFFEAVRSIIVRLTSGGATGKLSLPELNSKVNELLKATIQVGDVVNLFQEENQEISLFDESFLEELAKMKEENLALNLLKKLLEEQITVYKKSNVVQSKKFSDLLQEKVNLYLNGMITSTEVMNDMLAMARLIREAHNMGNSMGLTPEELAFYDALTKPQAIKDFYENDQLVAITKELTEALQKNKTVDWQKKESARANMRKIIKRLLKKYKYPPEGYEEAMDTVMEQCELWTDSVMSVK